MYIPSEEILINLIKSEWEALKDQLVDPESPINEWLSGYPAEEIKDIKKEYLKAAETIVFLEAFPREPVELPSVIVEENQQPETEQYLGATSDIEYLEGEGTEIHTLAFRFQRVTTIEIVSDNKDLTKHLTVLIRFILLKNRHALETNGGANILKQRLQQINGVTREPSPFPVEAFVRTILFSFEADETIKLLTKGIDITAVDAEEVAA